jgi:spore coat polysaccharide biosynthesis protein SpsF
MRVEAFVQARMGSTRLPGKVLMTVLGRPLLDYLNERLGQSEQIDDFAVLTTDLPIDDPIESFCHDKKIRCFRGSENDVLDRYTQAALQWKPDGIVRVTADCPLIDPEIVDEVVGRFKARYPAIDYVSNTLERTFPRGLDVEVVSFPALEKCDLGARKPEEREHVTPYLYRNPKKFRLENVSSTPSWAFHRWTVDTQEDFALVSRIIEALYPTNPHFRLQDVLTLLSQHPDWVLLNAHVEQKNLSER